MWAEEHFFTFVTPRSSIIRASHWSLEGCLFNSRLMLRNVFQLVKRLNNKCCFDNITSS